MKSLIVSPFMTSKATCKTCYLKYHTCCQHVCALNVSNFLTRHYPNKAFLRVAAIKLLIKVQNEHVDPLLKALLSTVVRISEIVYSHDSERTPKSVLRLYNLTRYHHELCCYFLSNPKLDLVVHAPAIYQQVCLRSTNTESQERLFSQAKHIGLKTTIEKQKTYCQPFW